MVLSPSPPLCGEGVVLSPLPPVVWWGRGTAYRMYVFFLLFIYLSIYLFIYLVVFVFIYLFICFSIYLSIYIQENNFSQVFDAWIAAAACDSNQFRKWTTVIFTPLKSTKTP